MPTESLLGVLRHVWRALEPLDAPMAVMGGIALAAWKHVRATRDVDLLLGIVEEHSPRLWEALKTAGIRPKRSPAAAVTLGQLELIELYYEPPDTFLDFRIDLLLAKSGYHRQALDRRVPMRLAEADVEVDVLACEDLILHKLLAERAIDIADAVALLRGNRQSLDFAYLRKWAELLHVAALLEQSWQAAWPQEPLPA